MTMDGARELVVVVTKGIDHELSSVAFNVANAGITSGLKVYAFLTSAAVDLVRKGAVDLTHVAPLEPLKAQIAAFIRRGGTIWAAPACMKARGYTREDLVEGVELADATALSERILAGAATLSF